MLTQSSHAGVLKLLAGARRKPADHYVAEPIPGIAVSRLRNGGACLCVADRRFTRSGAHDHL